MLGAAMPVVLEMGASPATGCCDAPAALNFTPTRTMLPPMHSKPSPYAVWTWPKLVPSKYMAPPSGMPLPERTRLSFVIDAVPLTFSEPPFELKEFPQPLQFKLTLPHGHAA